MLQAGIVGLPNVGKSTLFNVLTKSRKADAQNYPFCTIEPNVGIVEVPDDRLKILSQLSGSKKIIPAVVEIVDIAGLVAGSSRGEGLGNKFLSNIREVDAIIHVVRCFEGSDIVHNFGTVDPVRDIEIINTELLLADLQSVDSQLLKNLKKAKSNDKLAQKNVEILTMLSKRLNEGVPAIALEVDKDTDLAIKSFNLLTSKPVIFACNIDEGGISSLESENKFVSAVRLYAKKFPKSSVCEICVRMESDVIEFSDEEAKSLLSEFGIKDRGISELIRGVYEILGLSSFLTTGEDETRAWTFRRGMRAPECAGVIHGDFESGFIKAEVIGFEDLISYGGWNRSKESGKIRLEGKDYLFKDGDVVIFRFNR